MPEGPRTIHIFMNFLQCYSLWRTVFEPNHCEYRVDLLNWREHSCPTFKNAGAKIVLHPLNTMIEYKRFWGDGQSVCHPGWPVYRPGYQGLLFEKSAHGGNFFRLLATARLMAQRYWEGFDIPTAEMDEPIWQTKLPPQLSDWCKLARCTNYQFSTIMWEKLTHPTTHSRTSQVAHRIVCSPMLMIGWTNHFCGQCQNVAHSEWQATKGALIDTRFQSICLLSRPLWGRRLPPKN